jgi:hypothetical protein
MDGATPPYTVAIYEACETETHLRLMRGGNVSVTKNQHRLDIQHFLCKRNAI